MTTTIGSLDLGALNDLRDDVTQYFWFESNSSSAWGSGAHVTLYPESQFTDPNNANYLKGQNILMNTDGFSIRNGALPMMVLDNNSLDFNIIDTTNNEYTNVARFGAVSTIGVTDNTQSYLRLDYHSMRMIDKEGNDYFEIKDLRDENGEYDATDSFIGDGETDIFYLTYQPINTSYTVSLNGVEVTSGVSKYNTYIYFDVPPAIGDTISVNYITSSVEAKCYTLGMRSANGKLGSMSLAEGRFTTASGSCSHAEGFFTTASAYYSHAEGNSTTASGNASHAEGYNTKALSNHSHAEGNSTTARGIASHAEGYNTTTSDSYSHAEGYESTASGYVSHAEGRNTTASGSYAHTEGGYTNASGDYSHAEGYYTSTAGDYSHANGYYTTAYMLSQTAIGTYNIQDFFPSQAVHPNGSTSYGNYAFIIGNGTSENNRSNALTVAWDSTVAFADPSKTFFVTTESFSYSAISNGSSSGAKSVTFSPTYAQGYYPIGIMGLRTGNSAAVPTRFNLSSRASGSATFTYVLRAVGSVSAGSGDVDILWIKIA